MNCPKHGDVKAIEVVKAGICPVCLEQAIAKTDLKRWVKSKDLRSRALLLLLHQEKERLLCQS